MAATLGRSVIAFEHRGEAGSKSKSPDEPILLLYTSPGSLHWL